jgi:hypothetical protein
MAEDGSWFVERLAGLLVRHFQEKQKGELLHKVGVADFSSVK